MRRALCAAFVLIGGCAQKPARSPERSAAAPPRITQFYASQGEVARGGSVSLCYGVEGASAVRLEPPVEAIKPSLARCIAVAPSETTSYKLIASSGVGEVSESVTVRVASAPKAPAPPAQIGLIRTFEVNPPEIDRGGSAVLCYEVAGEASATLEPGFGTARAGEKTCVVLRLQVTTRYTLTATSGETTETKSVSVKVR